MGIARRFPIVFFIIAIIVIANNYLQFAPGQVLPAPQSYIVPGIMIWFGCLGTYFKRKGM